MSEQIWRGQARSSAELADEIAAVKSTILRLPYVEPMEIITIRMSVANRDMIVSALRAAVGGG